MGWKKAAMTPATRWSVFRWYLVWMALLLDLLGALVWTAPPERLACPYHLREECVSVGK
jgi:hypothetical protein